MGEKIGDGFIPVLEDEDLKEGTSTDISIQGIPVLLIKKDGVVFAIHNQCPHLGIPLSIGYNGDYHIICPNADCQGFIFDIKSGILEPYPESGFNLRKFESKIRDGKIWVRLM